MEIDPGGLLIADRFLAAPTEGNAGAAAARRALDKKTGRSCRVFELAYSGESSRQAGLWAQHLLKVRHPSLENLLGFEERRDGRSAYWICEDSEGRSFAELAAEGRPFSETEAAGMTAALAGALRALRAGAPDLPPLNISPASLLLTPGGRPVLAGLGAFIAQEAITDYQAPGDLPAEAADIYSLGASLAFLFSRKKPAELQAGGGLGALKAHTGFSDEFCGLLAGMTAGHGGGRFRTAQEVEERLKRLLAGAAPSRLRAASRAALLAGLLAAAGLGGQALLDRGGAEATLKGGGVEWAMPGGLAFSAAGDVLALAGDKELYLWTAGSWKRQHYIQLQNLDGKRTRSVVFFPDGRLAVGSATGEGSSGLRVFTGALQQTWEGPLPGELDSLAVSPDGRLLAAAVNDRDRTEGRSVNGRILVFDSGSMKPVTELATPGGPAHALSFDPGGRALVYRTLHWQESAKAWNLGRVVRRSLDGGDEEVLLADPKQAPSLKLFSRGNFGLLVLPEPGSEALGVYAPGGRLRARLNEDSLSEEYQYTNSAEGVFSPDGLLFAAHSTVRGRLYLRVFSTWDWRRVAAFRLGKQREGGVAGIAFSPDGRLVAAAQGDAFRSKVRIFSLEGGK